MRAECVQSPEYGSSVTSQKQEPLRVPWFLDCEKPRFRREHSFQDKEGRSDVPIPDFITNNTSSGEYCVPSELFRAYLGSTPSYYNKAR
jgi:hypothetical protein